jgi:hypothetical protein
VDIGMFDIFNKKSNSIRDRAILSQPDRSIPLEARDLPGAVSKLREIKKRSREFHNLMDPNSAENSPRY